MPGTSSKVYINKLYTNIDNLISLKRWSRRQNEISFDWSPGFETKQPLRTLVLGIQWRKGRVMARSKSHNLSDTYS